MLELKIAQGNRIRNLTHQAGGLGTELQVRCPHQRGQAVQLGSRGGTLGLSLGSLGSPFPTLCHRLGGESATLCPVGPVSLEIFRQAAG